MTTRFFDYLIGFDDFAKTFSDAADNYPPFDVFRTEEDTVIEFALAGFKKENISVIVENKILRVSAKKNDCCKKQICEKPNSYRDYTHRGIALRSFTKQFALAEHAEVQTAEYENGVLRIRIRAIIPDSLKPREIPIQ